jgi:hypothetical protein
MKLICPTQSGEYVQCQCAPQAPRAPDDQGSALAFHCTFLILLYLRGDMTKHFTAAVALLIIKSMCQRNNHPSSSDSKRKLLATSLCMLALS